jgi:hypothetical protein
MESCRPQPKVRPSHQPTSVPQKFSKMEPNAERLVEFWIRCDSLSFCWYDCTRRVHSLVVSNQEYDPHINRHRFPKIFQKWNRTPKGSSNFSNVIVYLFVDTRVHSLVVPNQKYDPHINRRRSPQKFSKKKRNRMPKGSSNFRCDSLPFR